MSLTRGNVKHNGADSSLRKESLLDMDISKDDIVINADVADIDQLEESENGVEESTQADRTLSKNVSGDEESVTEEDGAEGEEEGEQDDDVDDDNDNNEGEEQLRINGREISKLFLQGDKKKLSRMLQTVDLGLPSGIRKYQKAVEAKEKKAERLISALIKENELLKKKVVDFNGKRNSMGEPYHSKKTATADEKSMMAVISILEASEQTMKEEIKSLREELEIVQDSMKAKVEMVRLLSNLECSDITTTEDGLKTIVKQRGRRYTHHYEIVFGDNSKDENGDAGTRSSEVVYTPVWDAKTKSDLEAILPDYMTKVIVFPVGAIGMLSYELSKFLN
jgi:hypothetical protein